MRKSIYLLLSIFCLMPLVVSCISDETVDYSIYNDCAITAFALQDIEWEDTTANQYGEDSTYTTTITGTDYAFTIDQEKGLIYNIDSLPKGTHVDKILLDITADGNAVYRHNDSEDSTYYYLSSDTINFTKPIHAIVYSYSGNNSKEYTIQVNVHQQDGDESNWDLHENAWVGKDLEAPRAVTYGDKVAVFGLQDDQLMVTIATQGTMDWSEPEAVNGVSGTASYDNITVFQHTLYMLDNGVLYLSDDATNWTAVQTNTPISHLLGCNSSEIFGVYDNTFITSADAMSWNAEATEYPEFIPDSNIFSFHAQSTTNPNIERTVTFGQIKESTDTIAAAWYRDNGYQQDYSNMWTYAYTARDNKYALLNLNNLVVLYYKEYLMAFGNDCRNKGYARAFNQLYVSKDWGLTWKGQDDEDYDTYLELPALLYRNKENFAAYVDPDYNVWILMQGSGDVWCGYLNRMKFAE